MLSLLALAFVYALLYKYYRRWVEIRGRRFNIDASDIQSADPHKFTYKELALATKNFDPKQELGLGGFGRVYKGFVPGNKLNVAIKRVAPESNQGEREFLAGVMIIGKIWNRNLVRLQGWCHEKGELLLVYDYMPHGSLDKLLFRKRVAPEESPGSAKAVQGRELVCEQQRGREIPFHGQLIRDCVPSPCQVLMKVIRALGLGFRVNDHV